MTPWWPWSADDTSPSSAPGPGQPPAVDVELFTLSAKGTDALWQARADEAHRIVRDALKRHGRGMVPYDVLLDIQIALHPPKPLRPAVPVIPGRG